MDEDGRQLRREFQAVTQGTRRFESAEQVVQFYTVSLVTLFGKDAMPSSLKLDVSLLDVLNTGKSDVDVLLVEAVQESLMMRIVADWTHSIEARQLHDLVHYWYFGPASYDKVETQRVVGIIQQCALRTISRLLSSSSALHPVTLDQLKALCLSGLTRFSLPLLISAVLSEPNKARASVVWTETLRLLSSLPDRLANATQGQLPTTFSPTSWIEQVFVYGISATLNTTTLNNAQLKLLKDVLDRLAKLGYLSRAIDQDARGFWCSFLQASLRYTGATENWARLRETLGTNLRVKLDRTLVETLQYLIVERRGGVARLVTAQERVRPGSEGVGFLSKMSQETVAAVAQILAIFLRSHPSRIEETDSASESDTDSASASDVDSDDEVGLKQVRTFKTSALSGIPQSPLLAWGWVTYLWTSLSSSTLMLSCLKCTLDLWSDPTRISRSLIDEEVYLTTLIIGLVSSLPTGSTLTDGLSAVSRSAAVLDGVSTHLSHADPTIRRLGMLIAERLSAKSPNPSGKVLNFGTKIWNGVGEGKEEARVLRALADAWEYHASTIDSIMKEWGEVRFAKAVHGLGIQPAPGGQRREDPKEDTGEVAVVSRKKASGGKSRRFPQRVEPPPRRNSNSGKVRKPLISVIGSDDDQVEMGADDLAEAPNTGPLKMFSTTNNANAYRHRPSSLTSDSASSSSTSDDSDSDVAPDSSTHDIHKIAAELSGLNASETQSILSSAPLASTSTSTSGSTRSSTQQNNRTLLSDMDADREAHAPTFTKKPTAPVYISQLSPMLKSSCRSSIKLALRHAALLIHRKSHTPTFGAEVMENAVDLTLTLVALHDQFGIRHFESMRTDALIALALAAPQDTVGVLTEQVFGSQYTNTQRIAMMSAIAESAVQLSGTHRQGRTHAGVGKSANKVARDVISAAKSLGEENVPAIQRQKQLQVGRNNRRGSKPGEKLIVPLEHDSIHRDARSRSQQAYPPQGTQRWVVIAGPVYLFPLIQRFLAYQSYFGGATSTWRSGLGSGVRVGVGAGTRSLFEPSTVSLLLDSLTVLLSLAPNHVISSLSHPILQLVFIILSSPFSPTLSPPNLQANIQTASALNLLALFIHRSLESNPSLNSTDTGLLEQIVTTVQQLFSSLQQPLSHSQVRLDSEAKGEGGAGQGGITASILARAASVLLLVHQLHTIQQEKLVQALGFLAHPNT